MNTDQFTEPVTRSDTPRILVGLAVGFLGLFIFAIGAKPAWFGWDRSPVVGFVQIAVFLFGLALICLGGYISLHALWWGYERTIMSDIGSRLVWTGYVVTVFAGLADIFGMGSQSFPNVPYFGPWQASGVLIGQGIIAIGFLLLIPYRFHKIQK
ncbi:MAG: hypothetical protein IPN96_04925 [Anaerolineales bacterium]|jgi:hypothetical protein|uniref:hypothetical protein n=1 Tax=Candidatus Villigracilis proximus TaxID=3140683 RepID=UPI003134FB87|nr:hypothetical protein [Anaerolineales bacterium]MBK8824230.1 hypothetical protein [Anaerolineales bacterium]MBK9210353.1 hypothetical protein [Anaerolineales bacterium]